MAIKRSANILNQQRIDTNHLRSIESAVRSDIDDLLNGLITGIGHSYIVNGFELNMTGAIGSSAAAMQVIVASGSILHGTSLVSGTTFLVPSTTPNETLSSTTNTKVTGSFTPSAANYVGIEFNRAVDNTTTGQVYFWNQSNNSEFTKTVPLAETLNYKFVITSAIYASNVLPLAIVTTDSSNNVVSVEDRRPMLFRLGTAGSATPNTAYTYPWTHHVEGRAENPYVSSSSATSPFRGGDKQIQNMKEWFDSVMSAVQEIKGTTFWYSTNTGGSLVKTRLDLANMTMTGKGSITHSAATAGRINWSDDIVFDIIGSRLAYTITANPATTHITLTDDQAVYFKMVRGVPITPSLIFTNGGAVVTSVGAVSWTTSVLAGDFIKRADSDDTKYYKILTVDSTSQVTLTSVYLETDTGAPGIQAQYAWGTYATNAAPSTDRHLKPVARKDVPFNEDTYWLMTRQDNGGSTPRIYMRNLGELEQGETRQISDQTTDQMVAYMGSPSEVTAVPTFTSIATSAKTGTANYNSANEDLTVRSAKLTSMMADKAQDKTLQYADNLTAIINVTNGAAQDVTFLSAGVPTINVVVPSSTDYNNTITATGTLSLAANQVAYFTIDRNAAFTVANLAALTVVAISALPLAENVFVFAYRLAGMDIHLYDGRKLRVGANEVSAGYEETMTIVSGAPANDNENTGPIAVSATWQIPLNARNGNIQQTYVVGSGKLTITLNGLRQIVGSDYNEVGTVNTAASFVQVLYQLEIGDVLTISIA